MENEKVNLDLKTLKFLYVRYKDFGIPIIVIVVCLIVFVQFLFPQLQNLFALSQEAKNASGKISVLGENVKLLSSLDDLTLESYLKLVNAAVPKGKDFIGIINAISYASSFSGVEVKDFQLNIGDLSEDISDTNAFSWVSVSLSMDGGIDRLNTFIEGLNNTLPLSEIRNINVGASGSMIDVSFYYRAFSPIKQDDFSPIKPISSDGLALINSLSKFNYNFSESIGL